MPDWPGIRNLLWLRCGGRCEVSGRPLDYQAFDAHHRRNKGMGGTSRPDRDDLDNLLALDPEVHNGGPLSVHGRRVWSEGRGYLVPKHLENPGAFPVYGPTGRWRILDKEGGAEPYKPLRIGVTGSRHGMTPFARDWLHLQLATLHRVGAELHHGSCTGVDDAARSLARSLGYVTVAHPSTLRNHLAIGQDDMTMAPRPPLDRNHTIVELVSLLIAVPASSEHLRSGTWATVRYAHQRRVTVRNWQSSVGGRTNGEERPL